MEWVLPEERHDTDQGLRLDPLYQHIDSEAGPGGCSVPLWDCRASGWQVVIAGARDERRAVFTCAEGVSESRGTREYLVWR